MSDCCFILFRSPGISLERAAEFFAPPHWRVAREDGRLAVQHGASPVFRIVRSTEAHVIGESKNIGEGTPYAEQLSKCDCRFEIVIEDLDQALDEINTLIDIQDMLQEATDGYMFNCWNGELSPPEA